MFLLYSPSEHRLQYLLRVNTWRIPRTLASLAMAVATRLISDVSHVAAKAIACGNAVAPYRLSM
jgi:hypothetical protein